jgi:hypothetical protein
MSRYRSSSNGHVYGSKTSIDSLLGASPGAKLVHPRDHANSNDRFQTVVIIQVLTQPAHALVFPVLPEDIDNLADVRLWVSLAQGGLL